MHFHTYKKLHPIPSASGILGKRKHYVIEEGTLITDTFIRRTECDPLIFLRNILTISFKSDSMALVGPFQLRLFCGSVNIMLLFAVNFVQGKCRQNLKMPLNQDMFIIREKMTRLWKSQIKRIYRKCVRDLGEVEL